MPWHLFVRYVYLHFVNLTLFLFISIPSEGYSVAEARVMLRPLYHDEAKARTAPYLVYAYRFTPTSPSPDEATGMYRLQRQLRSSSVPANLRRLGDVIPIECIRVAVDVAIHHGEQAQDHLAFNNSMELSDHFLLNTFASRDLFNLIS